MRRKRNDKKGKKGEKKRDIQGHSGTSIFPDEHPLSCYWGDLRVEHALRAVTPVPAMRKPFDVLAEGLLSEKSRGDRTPLELFIAGVGGWEGHLRWQFENSKSK
jgi:hypothetical protein